MPQAVIGDQLGPIENYSLRSFDPGPPAAGEVRVAIRAAGVSFVDVLNAMGKYQAKAPVPFVPGSECAGVIEAVGAGVTTYSVGQKVVATSWGGVFADAVNLPAQSLHPMPEGMGFEEGAVFMVSATTSWHGLADRAKIQSGETVLVLGAGGATGYAAVQIARYLGARVIASASTDAKRKLALRGGADAAVEAGSENWRDQVKAANDGRPVDVVFDPVGGDVTETAFRTLGWNGRHLVVGFPGGIASLPTNLPLLKASSLVGVNVQKFGDARPEQARANGEKLIELAGRGLFHPAIAEVFPLREFAQAMNLVAGGSPAGRIVLRMG